MNAGRRQTVARIVVGLTTVSGLACSRPPAYSQEIVASLLRAGAGAGLERVRFVSSQGDPSCEVAGLEGVTDLRGAVRMGQIYQPSLAERYVVVAYHYRLCVASGSSWRLLWEETLGPAPRTIEFQCLLDEGLKTPCRVGWNGQGLK